MKFDPKVNHLWLDCDGVLADFDKSAKKMMGMPPEEFEKKFGSTKFWEVIHSNPRFFYELELMPDAMHLYNNVKHLKPTILTGIPQKMDAEKNEKVLWAAEKFGPDQKIICCRAKLKSTYLTPGDVIVDDRRIYKHLWEKAGGTFVLHTSAKKSLNELFALGVISVIMEDGQYGNAAVAKS